MGDNLSVKILSRASWARTGGSKGSACLGAASAIKVQSTPDRNKRTVIDVDFSILASCQRGEKGDMIPRQPAKGDRASATALLNDRDR